MLYISGRLKTNSIVGESGLGRGVYNFLWERWYINPAYYRAFVNGTLSVAAGLKDAVETGFFDRISDAVAALSIDVSSGGQRVDVGLIDNVMNQIAATGRRFSSAVRRIQTGVPQEYVTAFAIGLFALVVAVLFLLT